MNEGLAGLGFWLMVGMFLAATIITEGLKERDKERAKQATLRALLEKDGNSATEVLAYMREMDSAEAARDRARSAALWIKLKAIALGALALLVGLIAFAVLRRPLLGGGPESVIIPLVPMLVIWVAGLYMARRTWRSAIQKYDAHPDA